MCAAAVLKIHADGKQYSPRACSKLLRPSLISRFKHNSLCETSSRALQVAVSKGTNPAPELSDEDAKKSSHSSVDWLSCPKASSSVLLHTRSGISTSILPNGSNEIRSTDSAANSEAHTPAAIKARASPSPLETASCTCRSFSPTASHPAGRAVPTTTPEAILYLTRACAAVLRTSTKKTQFSYVRTLQVSASSE